MNIQLLQIDSFKDSDNLDAFICLLNILFLNVFNIFSLHQQHLLSLLAYWEKIRGCIKRTSDFLQKYRLNVKNL